MNALPVLFHRATVAGACLLLLGLVPVAHAVPVDIPFDGAGNVVVFDPVAGTGGWVGSIDEILAPGQSGPARSFVSVVTFSFDSVARLLSGQFEFTDAQDLATTVFGTVSGAFTDPSSALATGGQWSLDYTVAGGTGGLLGASGFGLSFLTYEPAATTFNNYTEQGLLALQVPLPGTVWLAGAGLGLMALLKAAPRARRVAGLQGPADH